MRTLRERNKMQPPKRSGASFPKRRSSSELLRIPRGRLTLLLLASPWKLPREKSPSPAMSTSWTSKERASLNLRTRSTTLRLEAAPFSSRSSFLQEEKITRKLLQRVRWPPPEKNPSQSKEKPGLTSPLLCTLELLKQYRGASSRLISLRRNKSLLRSSSLQPRARKKLKSPVPRFSRRGMPML